MRSFESGEAVPESVAVANKRSPNRKNRTMSRYHKRERSKEKYLKMLSHTGLEEEARKGAGWRNVDITAETVWIWVTEDEKFAKAREEIKEQWKRRTAEGLSEHSERAFDAIKAALEDKSEPRIRAATARWAVDNLIQLAPKKVEHSGPGGGPIRTITTIEVARPEPEPAAIVEGEMKELGEGQDGD